MKGRVRHLVWVWVWLVLMTPALAAPKFTASLDRNVVPMGEDVILTLVCEGGRVVGAPAPPAIAGLEMAFAGQSSSRVLNNTGLVTVDSFTYQLTATKPGQYTIPSMEAEIEGKTLTSQPLTLTVSADARFDLGNIAVLRLMLSKSELYLGEVLPFEVQLFATQGQILRLPEIEGEGFVFGKIIMQQEREPAQLNGHNYNLVRFKTYLRPVKTGQLTLGPGVLKLLLPRPGGRRNFFNEPELRPYTLTTATNLISVLSVPTNDVPPGYSGAVGHFSLSISGGPTNLGVGDPLTLKIKVSGKGAMESLGLPEQPGWENFRTYPSSSKMENQDGFGIEGTKAFEQVITPLRPEVRDVPPFLFSFFDPDQKKFFTLKGPEIPLSVHPTAATPAPTVVTTQAAGQTPGPREIVHIKSSLGTLGRQTDLVLLQPWFWLAQALGPLTWVGSIYLRRRREHLAGNPVLRRRKEVNRLVEAEIPRLRASARAGDAMSFFALSFRLLQERLGEKLNLPASAITEAVLDEHRNSFDTPMRELLQEIFRTGNEVRYTPGRSVADLDTYLGRVENALYELKKR